MSDFLATVVAERRADVAAARAAGRTPHGGALPARPFAAALRARRTDGRLAVIAEIKRVSPALGALAPIADPAELARRYEEAGAAAISVLTEPRHWGGSLDDLRAVRAAVSVPVLCKDVIVDADQLVDARAAGADAALLIAEAFGHTELRRLVEEAARIGLECLVEAHEPEAFVNALASGAETVGVNARDLRALSIDTTRVATLAPMVKRDRVLVAESGIATAEDARRLPERVDAILVGTALVRAADPLPLLRELARIERPAA